MIARLMRRLMTADALGISFVLLALSAFTYGISSSLQDGDAGRFFWFCLAAAAVSFGLGKSRWNGIQASAGVAALGILLVWILGARLADPLLDLGKAGFSLLPQIIPSIRYREVMDTTALLEAWSVIVQASAALMTRLQAWAIGFNQGVTVDDALVRNMFWTLVLWLCAAWMGWFAEKRDAVASLLPSILLLSAVTSYSEYRIESLWFMVVIWLFLMGIWNYRKHTLLWSKRRIDYSDSIRIDNTQAVLFLTLAVGTVAFLMPSISWHDIVDAARDLQGGNETAEVLGIQQQPGGPGGAGGVQEPVLPRDHLLSGNPANSERVVMTIRTGELPPVSNPSMAASAPRHYWRSVVYDQYAGRGWVTSTVSRQTVPANTPLIPGLLSGYRLVRLEVRMVEPGGRLFWSGVLFSADVPFTAEWRVRPPSDLFADQTALLQADMFSASSNADTYRAETYIPIPTIEDLRSAGADYPEEIRRRYLPLPRSVPNRVHDLARQITDGSINPYERAKAIENHLRTNYPYDLEVPAPPEGRDVADYFLFDLKRGYCDYYATAMVVLARSSGLPARFVSGYATGAYDAINAQYIVRELHAHSWAEVYFPEIGWVEFEPTASLPEIERRMDSSVAASGQGDQASASAMLTRFRLERILLWASPVIIMLVSILLYFAFIERWLVLRLPPEAAIENIYRRFYLAGRPLAGAWTSAETSSEFLHKFLHGTSLFQNHGRLNRLIDSLDADATRLTEVYHDSLFTRHRTQREDAALAWMIWRRLQRRLFICATLRGAMKFSPRHSEE